MWWFIALWIISAVAVYFLMPKPETAKPPEVQEVDIASVEDGKTIPVLFGTRNTESFNVVWWGDVQTRSWEDDLVIGYYYFVGIHAILFHGPIDNISHILSDDKLAWSGVNTGGELCLPKTSSDLYGGKEQGGGFGGMAYGGEGLGDFDGSGCIDIDMGYPDQIRNWYLEHNLDGGDAVGDTGAHEIPAFRGVVGAILKRVYIGTSPNLRKLSFRGQRIHVRQDGIAQWYDEKAEIPTYCGDAALLTPKTTVTMAIVVSCTDLHSLYPITKWPEVSAGILTILQVLRSHLVASAEIPWTVNLYNAFHDGTSHTTSALSNCSLAQLDSLILLYEADNPPNFAGATISWNDALQASRNFTSLWVVEANYTLFIHHAGYKSSDTRYYEPLDGASTTLASALSAQSNGYTQLNSMSSIDAIMFFAPEWFNPYGLEDESGGELVYGVILAQLTEASAMITNHMDGHILTEGLQGSEPLIPSELTPVSSYDWSAESAIPFTPIPGSQDGIGDGTIDTSESYPYLALDLNPSHMIRECLTDPDWGMGGSELSPDETSFVAAANTLYNENMGISIKWVAQTSIDDFIDLIKKHINAELYPDHTTGKQILKLIRDDYNVEDLLVLGEDDIVKVENANRPLIGELINSVTVQYWDTCINKDASVTVIDQALVQMQGATINTTIQYPGFTNKRIATLAATRDLRVLSSQLLSCTLYVKRTAEVLNLGDVFIMHWPDLEISGIIMRVQGIDFGTGRQNTIKLDVVEDVFGLPATVVVGDNENDPSWTSPIQLPVPVDYQVSVETPYYDLIQLIGQSELTSRLSTDSALGYVSAGATRPENAINAIMATESGSGYTDVGTLQFAGSITLLAEVDQIEIVWNYDTAIDLGVLVIGSHAEIDTELVRIDAIDSDTETITVARGVLDTSPCRHLAGAKLLGWGSKRGFDHNEYTDSDTINVKLKPVTSKGILDISDATAYPVTMDSRALRPYPPANFKVDAVAYPADVITDIDTLLSVTWAHRDRLTQGITPHTDGDTGPEAGTTYDLTVEDDAQVVKITHADLTGTSQSVDISGLSEGDYVLKITSKRSSVISWDHIQWEFLVSSAPIFSGTIADMTAYVANAFSFDVSPYFSTGGVPTSYTLQNNPAWMFVDNLGEITGTPTSESTTSGITVTGINVNGDDVSNVFSMTVNISYSSVILGDSPNGYWRLENDLTDEVGADDLIQDMTPVYITGAVGIGLSDTRCRTAAATQTVRTFEVWFMPSSATGQDRNMGLTYDSSGYNHIYQPQTNGSINFTKNGAFETITSAIPDQDEWTHLVITDDGTTTKFFINGIKHATEHTGSYFDPATRTHRIVPLGWMFGGNAYGNIGDIDEVAVYDVVLSDARILAHYNAR